MTPINSHPALASGTRLRCRKATKHPELWVGNLCSSSIFTLYHHGSLTPPHLTSTAPRSPSTFGNMLGTLPCPCPEAAAPPGAPGHAAPGSSATGAALPRRRVLKHRLSKLAKATQVMTGLELRPDFLSAVQGQKTGNTPCSASSQAPLSAVPLCSSRSPEE